MYRNYVIIAYIGSSDKKLIGYYGSLEGAKKRALDVYNKVGATFVEIATENVCGCVDYNGQICMFDKIINC